MVMGHRDSGPLWFNLPGINFEHHYPLHCSRGHVHLRLYGIYTVKMYKLDVQPLNSGPPVRLLWLARSRANTNEALLCDMIMFKNISILVSLDAPCNVSKGSNKHVQRIGIRSRFENWGSGDRWELKHASWTGRRLADNHKVYITPPTKGE